MLRESFSLSLSFPFFVCILHSFFAQTTRLRQVISRFGSGSPSFDVRQYLWLAGRANILTARLEFIYERLSCNNWDCARMYFYICALYGDYHVTRPHCLQSSIAISSRRAATAACFSDLLPSSVLIHDYPPPNKLLSKGIIKKKTSLDNSCLVCTRRLIICIFMENRENGVDTRGTRAPPPATVHTHTHRPGRRYLNLCREKGTRRRQTEEKSFETLVMSLSTQKHPSHSFYSSNQIHQTEVWGTSKQLRWFRPLTRIFSLPPPIKKNKEKLL
jgi:hypothetical protein